MSKVEGADIEQGTIPEAVIARQKKEQELRDALGVLDEIVGRAENTQGDLRDSVVLLRATLSRMYENFLAQVREGDEKGAAEALSDSSQKAENVKRIAVDMETAMDEFRKIVNQLKGQIQN